MQPKTFHEHDAPEIRATALANKKRVDFHIFEADGFLPASMQELFDKAEDGHKYNLIYKDGKLTEVQK